MYYCINYVKIVERLRKKMKKNEEIKKNSNVNIYYIYTVEEVAKLFKVSKRTVYNWIYLKKLKVIKVGREYRIKKQEVERILNKGI